MAAERTDEIIVTRQVRWEGNVQPMHSSDVDHGRRWCSLMHQRARHGLIVVVSIELVVEQIAGVRVRASGQRDIEPILIRILVVNDHLPFGLELSERSIHVSVIGEERDRARHIESLLDSEHSVYRWRRGYPERKITFEQGDLRDPSGMLFDSRRTYVKQMLIVDHGCIAQFQCVEALIADSRPFEKEMDSIA